MLSWYLSESPGRYTFGEVPDGTRSGPTKRQYWIREGNQWKIFYEGNLG